MATGDEIMTTLLTAVKMLARIEQTLERVDERLSDDDLDEAALRAEHGRSRMRQWVLRQLEDGELTLWHLRRRQRSDRRGRVVEAVGELRSEGKVCVSDDGVVSLTEGAR